MREQCANEMQKSRIEPPIQLSRAHFLQLSLFGVWSTFLSRCCPMKSPTTPIRFDPDLLAQPCPLDQMIPITFAVRLLFPLRAFVQTLLLRCFPSLAYVFEDLSATLATGLHRCLGLQTAHVIVDGLEFPLGRPGQDGQLVEGLGVAGVDVTSFLVILSSFAVVGRVLNHLLVAGKITEAE